MRWLSKDFSLFQSCPLSILISLNGHVNAETPGEIHEDGELGYALSVSFGAAFNNLDLIVACVGGDGEAESGLTAMYVFSFHHQAQL